jgi:hypothetical protein
MLVVAITAFVSPELRALKTLHDAKPIEVDAAGKKQGVAVSA